jgi:hypothetical protein
VGIWWMVLVHCGQILLTSVQCFFIGEFSAKVDLKNVISTNTKDFSWEK